METRSNIAPETNRVSRLFSSFRERADRVLVNNLLLYIDAFEQGAAPDECREVRHINQADHEDEVIGYTNQADHQSLYLHDRQTGLKRSLEFYPAERRVALVEYDLVREQVRALGSEEAHSLTLDLIHVLEDTHVSRYLAAADTETMRA